MDGDKAQGRLFAALEDRDALTLRVYLPYWVRPETPLAEMQAQASQMRQQFNSDKLRAGGVKFFMDGVYESYTAVSLAGYPDQPNHHGEPIWPAEKFAQFATAADALGLQIFVHACGDGAVRRVLDGYEAAMKVNGCRDHRHRVEHIEMVHPQDVPRFAELGVIASMQPLHAPKDAGSADVWPQRIAPEAWQYAFAWQTLRQARATLAFGSDWPVVSLNPLLGIHAAVNRQPWQPSDPPQAQTIGDAICSYTRGAAYAEFQEEKKGQIKPGFLADLVLLCDNIFAVPLEEIDQLSVDLTLCDGCVTYQKES
jgi:predicted amidohydrolase YtcJ